MNTSLRIRKADLPTQDDIIEMVNRHEVDTESWRARMESDYDLLQLLDVPDSDGYRTYVSNAPMTFLDKLVAWLVGANLIIRFKYGRSAREERERFDAAERFLYGILDAADERLESMLELPLRDQLAWYVCARGAHAGRALLSKEEDGSTYVDIMPWDPLHVFWGVNRKGLAWVCHRSMKTVAAVDEEYGLVVEGRKNDDDEVEVFDWYNDTVNMVVIDKEWAKEPTPHGASRVPVHLGMVGPNPMVRRRNMLARDSVKDYGDSVFKANRSIYGSNNLIMSTMLHLVMLTRKRAYTLTSADGTKTLDDNPFMEGAQVPLSERDKLEILPLLDMSKDTGAFLGLVGGELQRGALPYPAYGELSLPISGYAIKLLSQSSETPLAPRTRACEQAYRQISMLILDQFVTGDYEPMQLSGRANNRRWFDQQFSAEMFINIGKPEIKLATKVPQDDQMKLQMAQLARQGPNGNPLLPDIAIYDDILELEDADLLMDQINEQMAEQLLPQAKLLTLMKAAEERGRHDLAALYYGELIKLTMMQGGPVQPGGGNGANAAKPGSNPGYSPETLPNAAQGQPPPQPTPQAGPLVPPGTPRPGAQRGPFRGPPGP